MIALVILSIVILILAAALLVVGFIRYFVRKSNYEKANNILKRVPFLVDSRGYLTPDFVAYIALRAGDLKRAGVFIDGLPDNVPQPVVYLLRIALLSMKSDWQHVLVQYKALENSAAAESLNISSLGKLGSAIKDKDVDSVMGYFEVSGFGSITSPLYLSQSN